MEYIKGKELEQFNNCTIGKESFKVEVALCKIVDYLNKEEKKYQIDYPNFKINDAIKLECGDDRILALTQKKYLAKFDGFNEKELRDKSNNAITDAFNKKYFDFYTKHDLPY